MRQDAFFHAGEEDDFELQPLRRVQSHQCHALLRLVAIEVGHQGQRVEVIAQRRRRIAVRELPGGVEQLVDVLQPRFILHVSRLLKHAPVAGAQEKVIQQLGDRIARGALQVMHDFAKFTHRLRCARREKCEVVFDHRPQRGAAPLRFVIQRFQRRIADSARRHVDHPLDRWRVMRPHRQTQISQHVLDLRALVELYAADHGVRHVRPQQLFFERP